ncbi:UNVERIFIED_CONTAM: hypothetical protein FKN15_068302 [Acipenser sinensis]
MLRQRTLSITAVGKDMAKQAIPTKATTGAPVAHGTERQWRRAPPQQQAQSRGSMTAPSGVSARGQPAFVRPQRGGWRPRGGGRPRPRGSGQAPRERAQPKQP